MAEPTDKEIIEAIGVPYHCQDCMALDPPGTHDEEFAEAITNLRTLFKPKPTSVITQLPGQVFHGTGGTK